MELTGLLVRLALGNAMTLPIRFPVVLFKKLKGMPLSAADLRVVDPELADSLVLWRREYVGGTDFDLTFTYGGVPICDGGDAKKVTAENFDDFFNGLVMHVLVKRVRVHFEAFETGFKLPGDTPVIRRLSARDYALLLCVPDVGDWSDIKKAVTYRNYTEKSRAVVLFWKIFDEMTPADKGRMLQFVTGSAKAPIGGLEKMVFIIERGEDPTQLPIARTCQNLLQLPDNTNEQRVRANLALCVANSEGFGFN
jgi:hypothetical protein